MMTASPGSIRHRASRSSPCCAPERISTLSRGDAVAVGDRACAARAGLRSVRAPTPRRIGRERVTDRLEERLVRKAIERRPAGGERQQPRVRRVADDVAERRVAGAQRRRGNLAAPGERRPFGFRRRADERAAADVAAQQPARFELAIGADDGRAADLQLLGERALRRNARAGRQFAAARSPIPSSATRWP